MLYKERFMEYLKDNFTIDNLSYAIIERIIDYGNEHYSHSKNGVSYFIFDILELSLYIDFDEISQFEDFNTDYEEFKKRKYFLEVIKW